MTTYLDADGIPWLHVTEPQHAADAAAALANLVRRGQAWGDVVDMLGLDGAVAS